MPKSMTGFGSGECSRYDRKIKVEIRATNKRDNTSDISLRMPSFLDPLENKIRRQLTGEIARGIVHVTINVENFDRQEAKPEINLPLADAVVEGLQALSDRYGFGEVTNENILKILATTPGMFKLPTQQSVPSNETELWETLSEALAQALEGLNKSRSTEGGATAQDIEEKLASINHLIANIEARMPDVEIALAEKIQERIDEIVNRFNEDPDMALLVSEIGLFVGKKCINEEIVRAKSHLEQISLRLSNGGVIGRDLEFTIKELKREMHTMSAKSVDVYIVSWIIEAKVLIEKIHEQILNIE